MIKENKTYDSAFFYLTIKGDTLNPEELNNVLNLPCDIFHKGEITFKEYKGKQIYSITQNGGQRGIFAEKTKMPSHAGKAGEGVTPRW